MAVRGPLGDATQRVVNRVVDLHDLEGGTVPNTRPAHKYSKSVNSHLQSVQATASAILKENVRHQAPVARPTAREDKISQHVQPLPADEDQRTSVHSNVSSGASSRASRQLKTHVGPWQLGRTLGQGSSGRVRAARHTVTRLPAAVKIVSKKTSHLTQAPSLANLDHIDKSQPLSVDGVRRMPLAIEREIAIMKLTEHPNIVKLYDIWENRSEIYLLLEYVEEGDLFHFINRHGSIPEEDAIYLFRQIMSGVGYCHSYSICHRDLKPENILLDRKGRVKIADFGMAALQQSPDHALRTACGSPHYAAPELLAHRRYRGDMVDIWSMGVILFAMLAGHLPFENKNTNVLLQTIMRGEYKMSPKFSDAAADLIGRILVVNPNRRLNMMQMWSQPAIAKYDYTDKLRENGGQPSCVRRSLKLSPIAPADIDAQILRQLRALWHTFSEADIRRCLTSQEPTEQKVFYWLLHGYREKQLEEFNPHLAHSQSDFHHMKPPSWGTRISTCQFSQPAARGSRRSVSRFTVISTVAETDAGTIRSYDPYNASQFQFEGRATQAKIIVHRNGTRLSAERRRRGSVSHSSRSFGSAPRPKRPRNRLASTSTAATSRLHTNGGSLSSIQSSRRGTAPCIRANLRHKRGVDFSNVRKKTEAAQRLRADYESQELAGSANEDSIHCRGSHSQQWPMARQGVVRNSESLHHQALPQFASANMEPVWQEELKDFSHRIAQDLDDAFHSSLLASPSITAPSETRDAMPLSLRLTTAAEGAVGIRASLTNEVFSATKPTGKQWETRPLPPLPHEQEMPAKAAAQPPAWPFLDESSVSQLKVVGRDIQVGTNGVALSTAAPTVSERRIVSAPVYSRYARENERLPAITEHTPNKKQIDAVQQKLRTASAPPPVPASPHPPLADSGVRLVALAKTGETIRVVHSPTHIRFEDVAQMPQPLKLRKKSAKSTTTAHVIDLVDQAPIGMDVRHQSVTNKDHKHPLTTSAVEQAFLEQPSKEKRVSWFRRGSHENSQSNISALESQPRAKRIGLFTRHKSQGDVPRLHAGIPTDEGKKKSFPFYFWGNPQDAPRLSIAKPDDDYFATPEGQDMKSPHQGGRSRSAQSWYDDSEVSARRIEVHQNWLARLFRVKPATRYLCLCSNRRRVRQEVAVLLREWRKYGICDVEVDKERNIVFAKVGAKNYLNMREVSFAAEIMTVIEHGKRNQLCIVRFTQERGAASSFHKVADTMQNVLKKRNMLVADKRKAKMMIKTLNS